MRLKRVRMEYDREISKLKVSVLPDFYLDRIVSVPSLKQLFRQVQLKAASGGGHQRIFSQIEPRRRKCCKFGICLSVIVSEDETLLCRG